MSSLIKHPDEVKYYLFDFARFAEIVAGDIIATIVSVTCDSADLTLASASIIGSGVQVRISGGADKTHYNLWCEVTTSGGSKLVEDGAIFVSVFD
jgi:hypothetical protein